MTEALENLIEKALGITMSEDQARAQRVSFAYGNTHIENPLITRRMIEEADARIDREEADRSRAGV